MSQINLKFVTVVRLRNEAVSGDHNSNPVAVSTYLKDGEKVTPEIKDANGATVSSQPVPAGYSAKEGDYYTYAIWDLTRFNETLWYKILCSCL